MRRLNHSLVTTVIEVKVMPESDGGFDRIAPIAIMPKWNHCS